MGGDLEAKLEKNRLELFSLRRSRDRERKKLKVGRLFLIALDDSTRALLKTTTSGSRCRVGGRRQQCHRSTNCLRIPFLGPLRGTKNKVAAAGLCPLCVFLQGRRQLLHRRRGRLPPPALGRMNQRVSPGPRVKRPFGDRTLCSSTTYLDSPSPL